MPLQQEVTADRTKLIEQFHQVRRASEDICRPLITEDYVVQSIEDVSPPKWHLGHMSWFYEQVVLDRFLDNYCPINRDLFWVFNSYYESFGERVMRVKRGTLSRPSVQEVYDYRRAVDERMAEFINSVGEDQLPAVQNLLILGLNHEQQHQELLISDIKHILCVNPLRPAYTRDTAPIEPSDPPPLSFIGYSGGVHEIGARGDGFSYDNERPRHEVLLRDFKIADRLVTCGEFLKFIEAGGYHDADLWLSDAWALISEEKWEQPWYWEKVDGHWHIGTLTGFRPLNPAEPACHLNYFEAAAYARWAGRRLPTEAEWEVAAASLAENTPEGNFLDSGRFHPVPLGDESHRPTSGPAQMFGDVWEWTASAYLPYPGYVQERGPLGEYNGKFMMNQMVCRGGSCATPRSHFRPTYRNFFQPEKRWQFTGFRLAADA